MIVYQIITNPTYSEGRNADSTRTRHSSAFRAFTAGWEAFTEGGLVIVIVRRTMTTHSHMSLMFILSPCTPGDLSHSHHAAGRTEQVRMRYHRLISREWPGHRGSV